MSEIVIDLKTTSLTMCQLIEEIRRMQTVDPTHEYFLDGDLHAVVSREIKNQEVQG